MHACNVTSKAHITRVCGIQVYLRLMVYTVIQNIVYKIVQNKDSTPKDNKTTKLLKPTTLAYEKVQIP